MNRKLLVTQLQKNIRELDMITEGFLEMTDYPKAIILLAQQKTEDIQEYIKQLAELKVETPSYNKIAQAQQEIPVEELCPQVNVSLLKDDTVLENTIDVVEETPGAITIPEEYTSDSIMLAETPQVAQELITAEETNDIPKPETKTENQTVISGEKLQTAIPSRNETLSKTDNSIGSILANKKISDIKQAINISDRFRFQRELFKGNGEDMNKTLHYINQLATFEEATSFLQSKYNWALDNETAEDFLQITKRRFI